MRVKQPEIIFEDDAVIVCRKEAGVAVQTAISLRVLPSRMHLLAEKIWRVY